MTEDADTVLIGLGTVCMPGRAAVRRLREQGHKVGYVNLRWFRPFPAAELRASLGRFKAVGVIDRDFAHGSADDGGILLHEVRSALYSLRDRPITTNFICGLGGRDISINDCLQMFDITMGARDGKASDEVVTWLGLRE
jgi:pyruvate ferredoxin oxidoreductase alpha subunit